MDKQVLNNYIETLKSEYDHYYSGYIMHPEEGKDFKLNESLKDIKSDLDQVDTALIQAGNQVNSLMTNTILRLNNVYNSIITEKERYQDMQMLCNKYTDFDNVKLLTDKDFNGDFTYEKEVFSPKVTSSKKVNLNALQVYGNGYEGNKYVYNDYIYTNDVMDTSIKNNMTDNKITSYYEYSRITCNNNENITIADFNKDNKDAQCTITYQAEEYINEISIFSDDSNISITNVSYTIDDIEYKDINIPYLSINNKIDSYGSYGYIYGSGIIAFPEKTKSFKITYQSSGYKNDLIAYEKILVSSDLSDENSNIDEVTTIVKSAKRHVIKINEIEGYSRQYITKSKIQSKELISQDTYAISIFANTYIPQGLDENSITFILTINGKDYKVVPINSHINGTKIIRYSIGNSNSSYVTKIGEVIKSAYLTIVFTNKNKLVPYINNIKVLLGGEL